MTENIEREKMFKLLENIADEIWEMEKDYRETEEEAIDSIEEEVARRKKKVAQNCKVKIEQKIHRLRNGKWMSKCCDAEINYLIHTQICSDCGEEKPESYNVDVSIEDLINDEDSSSE